MLDVNFKKDEKDLWWEDNEVVWLVGNGEDLEVEDNSNR